MSEPNPVFELHAINMLLSSPTPLGRGFTEGNQTKIETALNELPLSPAGKVAAPWAISDPHPRRRPSCGTSGTGGT